ncbi:MAG TPA: hypothetical protein VJB87_05665 [Candidatus Nanoarchaeia archaeon]|nr:hypothetical protein [Candidatus Nanoarchaeia archaeon]
MNNKGFIRTLESISAIILILAFIYFILPQATPQNTTTPQNVKTAQNNIINELLYNDNYRTCIFQANNGNCHDNNDCNLQELITENTPYGYEAACEICNQVQSCIPAEQLPLDKSLYVNSIYLIRDQPKILRVYLWEQE